MFVGCRIRFGAGRVSAYPRVTKKLNRFQGKDLFLYPFVFVIFGIMVVI